ncbi:MAG TPA: hypothetical protein VGB58_09340 [Blastococcus sp.]|jgi:GGDEF domain-containing protein
MTTAPNAPTVAASPEAAVADATALLPSRTAVLARIAEQLSGGGAPHTLMVIGLLRRNDGWPTAQSTLARVTTLLAGSLRGDDFLGKSGPGEFAVVLTGPVAAAEAAAARLVAAVPTLGIPDLTAAAGIAPLSGDAEAEEVLRRALRSLAAARRAGPGAVLRHCVPR